MARQEDSIVFSSSCQIADVITLVCQPTAGRGEFWKWSDRVCCSYRHKYCPSNTRLAPLVASPFKRWYRVVYKWNESSFRPPLCAYRLNWARRTSWGWGDDWDDTVLQTQDSKFEPWRSVTENSTSRSRRHPTILTFTRGWGRYIFCFFQTAETGSRTPNSGVKGSGANHYPTKGFFSIWNQFNSCIRLLFHYFIHCFMHCFIHSLSHWFIHWLIHAFNYLFINSLIH